MMSIVKRMMRRLQGFNSGLYWESRYAQGGNSGAGSYGRLAEFKAEIINQVVLEHEIKTVVDWGVGDGNQLAMLNFSEYLGVDVSRTIWLRLRSVGRKMSRRHSFMFHDCL